MVDKEVCADDLKVSKKVPKETTVMRVTYETSDFYFVAYLLTMGLVIDNIRGTPDSRRLIFNLSGTIPPDSESLSALFYAGKGLVSCLDYKSRIQELKSIIHDGEGKKILSKGVKV